jgi:hypothetical protein
MHVRNRGRLPTGCETKLNWRTAAGGRSLQGGREGPRSYRLSTIWVSTSPGVAGAEDTQIIV